MIFLVISARAIDCGSVTPINKSSLRKQRPQRERNCAHRTRRGLSFRRRGRGLFLFLTAGVMGPCFRRDDSWRGWAGHNLNIVRL